MTRTRSNPTGTLGRVSGFTLLETMLSIFFLAGTILATVSVTSRDLTLMTRTRTDFIGQTALRRRLEFLRLRSYDDPAVQLIPFDTCRRFDTDSDPVTGASLYPELRALPFGRGWECAERFLDNASLADLRQITVMTQVLERPLTDPNDPHIRTFRVVMVIARNGLNRQLNQ